MTRPRRVPSTVPHRLEGSIQAEIIATLRTLGCLVLVSTAGHRGRGHVKPSLGKGAPDLCIVDRGDTFWMETKRSRGGVLSADQVVWHAEMRFHGGAVYVVNDPKVAVDMLMLRRKMK